MFTQIEDLIKMGGEKKKTNTTTVGISSTFQAQIDLDITSKHEISLSLIIDNDIALGIPSFINLYTPKRIFLLTHLSMGRFFSALQISCLLGCWAMFRWVIQDD